MKITPILTQLRGQCPGLANHIAVGVDLALLQGNPDLPTPSAHVLPTGRSRQQQHRTKPHRATDPRPLRNRPGARRQRRTKALDLLHDLRAELWRALVGFKPGTDYSAIVYDGGEMVSINSSRAFYRLRFFAEFQLGRNLPSQPAESWHERELDGLSSFTGVTVRVDAIDPADPNLKHPGPDGRVELTFSGDVTP